MRLGLQGPERASLHSLPSQLTERHEVCACKVRALQAHSSDTMKHHFLVIVHLGDTLEPPGFTFQARLPILHHLGCKDDKMAPKKMVETLFQISSLMQLMVNGVQFEI